MNEPDFARLVNGYAELPPGLAGADAADTADTPAPPAPRARKAPSNAEERVAAKLALYEDYLAAEGYRYEIDEDGDIAFRREGRRLVLFASDDDLHFFRLSLPGVWECESENEALLALATINRMNRTYKVVKFVLVDGLVWANAELFLDPLDSFEASFDRIADLVCETAADFGRRMRTTMTEALQPAPPGDPKGDPQDESQGGPQPA